MKRRWIFASLLVALSVSGLIFYRYVSYGIQGSASYLRFAKALEIEPGTEGMIAALDEIERYQAGKIRTRWKKQWQAFQTRSAGINDADSAQAYASIAARSLFEGETERATQLYQDVLDALDLIQLSDDVRMSLEFDAAVAFMRLGEELNCANNPSASVCIIPLSEQAYHEDTRGSARAIDILENRILERDPHNLHAQWLLNIAYMTLGGYPEKVPSQYLIDMPGRQEAYSGPTFTNKTHAIGIGKLTNAGSVAVDDFNNDGYDDFFVTSWRLGGALRYFERQPDGRFEDKTDAVGLGGMHGGLNLIHGDFDNDGATDLYIMRGAWQGRRGLLPNSLIRNRKDGSFEDVTVQAGMLALAPSIASAFADLNNDGWLDLVVLNESRRGLSGVKAGQIYISNRDGTFEERSEELGFHPACLAKGVAIADFNNDRLQDIFVSCFDGPNPLYWARPKNENGLSYVVDGSLSLDPRSHVSFASWSWDYNNDGWEDLFVASYGDASGREGVAGMAAGGNVIDGVVRAYRGEPSDVSQPGLFENLGDGRFSDVTTQRGLNRPILSMGANFGDFNNDGWLDIYFGTGAPEFSVLVPNAAYLSKDGTVFDDITAASGLGHIQKGHGIAFADFDRDGDQDIYAQMGGGISGDVFVDALFENAGTDANWLQLDLQGVRSNRDGIGARVHIRVNLTDGTERSIFRTVGSTGSFGSAPKRLSIGLGHVESIKQVEILWPSSGVRQRFEDVVPDSSYRIVEGQSDIIKEDIQPLPLRGQAVGHDHD